MIISLPLRSCPTCFVCPVLVLIALKSFILSPISAPKKLLIFKFKFANTRSIFVADFLLNKDSSISSGPNVIVSLPKNPFAYFGVISNSTYE